MKSPEQTISPAQRLVVLAAAVLTAASGASVGAHAPDIARFVVSGLALACLAALVGISTEKVGEHFGPGPTGLLQSTLGNLPELFVAIFALRLGMTAVVQAALVGSLLSNMLLVLGSAFLLGAGRHGNQHFSPEAPRMMATLLTLAVAALLVPTLAKHLSAPASHHTAALSDAGAVALLAVYAASVPFWLRGGPETRAPAIPSAPQWRLTSSTTVLGLASVASAAVSEWFVDALRPAAHALGLSQVFTGLVVVAIASNAVEHATGVRFAWKARPDFAISTVLSSPLEVALFLTPLLVLVSHLIGPAQLTLVFPPLLVAALAIGTIVVAIVIYDGEYSWLEGAALVALYVIVAAAFWWG
ncbi:MAG: calcium/proton exchanger [Acidimicrobiales bacterium]